MRAGEVYGNSIGLCCNDKEKTTMFSAPFVLALYNPELYALTPAFVQQPPRSVCGAINMRAHGCADVHTQ